MSMNYYLTLKYRLISLIKYCEKFPISMRNKEFICFYILKEFLIKKLIFFLCFKFLFYFMFLNRFDVLMLK